MATYTADSSGVTATAEGSAPTGTVVFTMFVHVLITDTVLSPALVTYTADPSGVTATAEGLAPTGSVAVALFEDLAITDTSQSLKSPTQICTRPLQYGGPFVYFYL